MSAPKTARAGGRSGPSSDERPGASERAAPAAPRPQPEPPAVPEIGGPSGPEPTRYGDWEKGGRCTDF